MIEKWVHITYLGGNPWVLPIWAAFNEGVSAGKFPEKSGEMSELAIHLSTRLNMIPWIVDSVNQDLNAIKDAIKNIDTKYISTPDKVGYAFDLDDKITYNLLTHFDSFVFEIDSCSELITSFIRKIYCHLGHQVCEKKIGRKLKDIIQSEGGSIYWFESLQNCRNFFIHEGSPYFAIDISNSDATLFELLIMKENLKSFEDDSKYMRLRSEFTSILDGFFNNIEILQSHVIDFLRN